jgi:general L-amino acid transport system permease protein
VLVLLLLFKALPPFIDWAFLDAVWRPDSKACRAGEGACWGFIAEKHRFILFGTYPYDLHWRPAIATVLLIGLWIFSAIRRFWKWWLTLVWLAGLTLIGILMWGGVFGMPYVENERWGGLILTLLLTTFGVAFAFPLSILLALGRRSDMPVIRGLCVGYIELIRGVPLISLLFMASVMLPLFLPHGVTIDKLLRAQIAMIMFAAAYLAEVVRGGLQAIPKGQYDAAAALALPYWRRTFLIILPQALRISVPPLMNTFIAFFKDTSLVLIIGLFDLLSTVKISLNEPAWTGFGVEAYLFASIVYFVFCYSMSRYSKRLEHQR